MNQQKVKVRFAPSPTGTIHIGGIRTAFYNFLFAKKNKGEFLLRIVDTDQKRLVKDAEKIILNVLEWLGLDYHGNIIHQSQRLDLYKKYAQELLDKKIAYQKDGAVWLNIPENKTFEWTDKIGNKNIRFKGKDIEEFVILKSDGYPTYHFANVIDDHLMEITHVLRGEEWISSTPKHLYIYEIFGWIPPKFAHLPVILGSDHTKLSKRHGAKSVLEYKEEGYLKEAILNYIALLGWNPGGNREKMSVDQMIDLFKLEDVNTANPIFDSKKLEWLNGVWIRSLSDNELEKRLREYYSKDSSVLDFLNKNKTAKSVIIEAAKSRMRVLSDFKTLMLKDESVRKFSKEEKEASEKLLEFLEKELGNNWTNDKLLTAIKQFSKLNNISFKTIYFLMTGKKQGIGILELNKIYGKEFFIKNLKK
jgi:glutamyl-tRNA synthetase